MKAISKILAVVSLTVISISGNAQEVQRKAELQKPIKKVVYMPSTSATDSKVETVEKVEAQPVNRVQRPLRRIERIEVKELKKEDY